MKKLVLILALSAAFSLTVLGDIKPPTTPKPQPTNEMTGRIQVLDRPPGVFTGLDRDDVILEIPNGADDKDSE